MPDASFTVEIKGLEQLRKKAKDGFGVPRGVEVGIKQASVIVEGAAKRKVHKLSRKLADSTGHNITGQGLNTQGVVGPRPGFGGPRGYDVTLGSSKIQVGGFLFPASAGGCAISGASQGTRPKKRRVHRVNKSDPIVYGRYEEEGTRYRTGHPWLVPSLHDNESRITNAVNRAVADELKKSIG